ncbi:hypothetical protein HAX54_044742, partial [Datura stramonium]|nr:hypothetical protein [Datura stramonium]
MKNDGKEGNGRLKVWRMHPVFFWVRRQCQGHSQVYWLDRHLIDGFALSSGASSDELPTGFGPFNALDRVGGPSVVCGM